MAKFQKHPVKICIVEEEKEGRRKIKKLLFYLN